MLWVSSLRVQLQRFRDKQLHKKIGFNDYKEMDTCAKVFLLALTFFFCKILICILNFKYFIQLNI